jgi:hypothetical protein
MVGKLTYSINARFRAMTKLSYSGRKDTHETRKCKRVLKYLQFLTFNETAEIARARTTSFNIVPTGKNRMRFSSLGYLIERPRS